MSIFYRIYNYAINADIDAFAFDVTRYASMTDFVHGDGITYKTVYIPSFNLYAYYYGDAKKFVVYKSDETFNEENPKYTNVRKIKVSTQFCFELEEQYARDEESKQMAEKNKEYYENL